MLKTRIYIGLFIFVLCVGSGLWYGNNIPKQYKASAKIEIAQFLTLPPEKKTETFQKLVEQIKSKDVVYPVIHELSLVAIFAEHTNLPSKDFTLERIYNFLHQDFIQISQDEDPSKITITAFFWEPNLSSQLANGIVNSYLQNLTMQATSELSKAEGLSILKQKLTSQETRIEEIELSLNQASDTISKNERIQLKDKLELEKNLYQQLKSDLTQTLAFIPINGQVPPTQSEAKVLNQAQTPLTHYKPKLIIVLCFSGLLGLFVSIIVGALFPLDWN
ncbi:MAG: GNVR domain-containing protein [Verrucomicrobiota bacterium]